ncbi:MAG: cytochrome c biogenesis protein CcdA [Planctomycetota bacterium]|nr:cytochrome c biogenesis protein CcdA [Planctomycetota bacterium]
MTRFSLALLALGLSALASAPAAAQDNEAKASLYTRIEGDRASAALILRVTPGWYVYHTELGHPDAIGTPLQLDLSSEGIEWGEFVWPAPHVKQIDDDLLGKYTYNYHVGKIIAYATGKVTTPGAANDAQVHLVGQTCTDLTGVCVPYEETATRDGGGREKYWAGWPESLGAVASAAVIEPSSVPPTANPQPPGRPLALGPPNRVAPTSNVSGTLWARADEASESVRAVIQLEVAEHYHIYHGPTTEDLGHPEAIGTPTSVTFESEDVEWDSARMRMPTPERVDQGIPAHEGGGNIWINTHHGTVWIEVEGLLYDTFDPTDVIAQVKGQVCDDNGCQNWALTLEVSGTGPDEAFAWESAVQAGPDAGEGGADDESRPSLFKFLLAAVGWGIFTLLMPCTYPMIPITISFFTKQADARDGDVLPLSITYGVGIVSVFILIGLVFAPVIIPFATHPITNIVIGVLFLFFSLVLFGFIQLQPPRRMMEVAGKASATGGYLGVFMMGATLVVTSFTCTAPFVGTLLGSAATGQGTGQDVLRIVLGMGVFGLTMATPFVFLSLVPGKIKQMPQAGEWMNTLKVFLGFVEVAASLKFISNADIVWNWGILGRDVFLAAWCVIFAAAGIYLLMQVKKSGKANPRQSGIGVMTILLAGYFGYGVPGNALDEFVTTPLLPPYVVFESASPNKAAHPIIKDDWQAAMTRAQAEGKLVLVNFTGFT